MTALSGRQVTKRITAALGPDRPPLRSKAAVPELVGAVLEDVEQRIVGKGSVEVGIGGEAILRPIAPGDGRLVAVHRGRVVEAMQRRVRVVERPRPGARPAAVARMIAIEAPTRVGYGRALLG